MWAQGDQFRRLHLERSVVDTPSEHGVYSLELKQQLLDRMTAKQNKNREPKEVARVENSISETDSSNGLSSRLDRVKITGEVEDMVNGNSQSQTEHHQGRQPRQTKNNIREKTIVVKDETTSNKNVEKKENDKNRSKVLTQGDKLNIIKATRHLTSGDRAETETGGDKQDKPERREKKITDYHRQTKVNSRVTRPNILTKRESVTSRSPSSGRRPTSPVTTRSSSKTGRVRNGPVSYRSNRLQSPINNNKNGKYSPSPFFLQYSRKRSSNILPPLSLGEQRARRSRVRTVPNSRANSSKQSKLELEPVLGKRSRSASEEALTSLASSRVSHAPRGSPGPATSSPLEIRGTESLLQFTSPEDTPGPVYTSGHSPHGHAPRHSGPRRLAKVETIRVP